MRTAGRCPPESVTWPTPGTFVYQVKSDDTVAIRVIETGATDGERIAITKGLALGEEVVIDGVDRLRDGAKAEVPERASAATAESSRKGGKGERRGKSGE